MSVRTADKRNFLRGIKWDADDSRLSLQAALKAALRGQIQEVATGKVLVGTQANGQQVSFALPSSFDAPTAMRVIGELVDLYEKSVAALESGSSDAVIFAEMMDRLKPIKSFSTDHSFLRCA